jgi:polyketide synthase PksJ
MHPGMRVMLGGEVINTKDLNLWLDFYPDHRFINEYGPTETSVASSFFPIPVGPSGHIEMKTVSIGKPLANNTFYILDKQDRFCRPGVVAHR